MAVKPRIFLIDIETSPILGWSWEMWDSNILGVVQPSMVMCMAWKELGEPDIHCKALPDFKGYKPGVVNDEALIKTAWKVLDNADVIIGQNSERFDNKKLNARFIYHGLSSPSEFASIDTLRQAKKHFKFDSNKLDNLGQYLGEGKKEETGGFNLWLKCIEGDKEAWERMRRYNVRDVELLERIYLRLRPFITHPNLNVIADNGQMLACSVCLGSNVAKRGFSITKTGRKQRYQCSDCGSWSTGPWQRADIQLR